MTKTTAGKGGAGKPAARGAVSPTSSRTRSRGAPRVVPDEPATPTTNAPLAEDMQDPTSPDARYRMISEVAYRRYVERGCRDGGDFEDWLAAEAEVEQLLADRVPRRSRSA